MAELIQNLAALVSVAGAVAALIGWMLARRERKLAQQVEAYRTVNALYDQMIHYKLEYPYLLARAREWDGSQIYAVVDSTDPTHQEWSRYYTFVEMSIGFANAVLRARADGRMPSSEYDQHWERLVRLTVAEHYPMIADFLGEGTYVSEYLDRYIAAAGAGGPLDWNDLHYRLVSQPSA